MCPPLHAGERVDGAARNEQLGTLWGVVRDSTGTPRSGVHSAPFLDPVETWDFQSRPGRPPDPKASPGEKRSRGSLSTVEEAAWTAEATTDARGLYFVCELPLGVPIRAHARFRESGSRAVTFKLEDAVHTENFVLGSAPVRDPLLSLGPLPDSTNYTLPEVRVEVLSDSSVRARAESSTGAMRLGPETRSRRYEDRGATRIADLLRRHRLGGLTVKPMLRNYQQVGVCVEAVRRSPTSPTGCRMVTLVLDGAIMAPSEAARMLDAMALDQVETVEYLPPAGCVVSDLGSEPKDGAVVVTTRH